MNDNRFPIATKAGLRQRAAVMTDPTAAAALLAAVDLIERMERRIARANYENAKLIAIMPKEGLDPIGAFM